MQCYANMIVTLRDNENSIFEISTQKKCKTKHSFPYMSYKHAQFINMITKMQT